MHWFGECRIPGKPTWPSQENLGGCPRRASYAVSQRKRKLVEGGFGWQKIVGALRKLYHRGREKVGSGLRLHERGLQLGAATHARDVFDGRACDGRRVVRVTMRWFRPGAALRDVPASSDDAPIRCFRGQREVMVELGPFVASRSSKVSARYPTLKRRSAIWLQRF